MIIGVGVDVLEHERTRSWDDAFLRYAFSPAEREEGAKTADRTAYFAGRFCAKEATIKALNGRAESAEMSDIETLSDPSGAPRVHLRSKLASTLGDDIELHLSISHEEQLSMAFVVAERTERADR